MTTDVPLSVPTPSPLADFLRDRRRVLAPEDVGIERAKGRRRVGLRRNEVAELAGISVAYYTFIERGRDLRPSPTVVDALARALQLDADDRAELAALAKGSGSRPRQQPEEVTDEVEALLDAIEPNPAYVVGARWDILSSNQAARRLFSDWERGRTVRERNLLWFYCCDPAARSLFVDWEREAADQLALFREAFARHPEDPGFRRLLEQVFKANPDAQQWWERYDRDPAHGRSKRIRLDNGQVIRLRQLVLQVLDDPDLRVVAYFSDADGDFDGIDAT